MLVVYECAVETFESHVFEPTCPLNIRIFEPTSPPCFHAHIHKTFSRLNRHCRKIFSYLDPRILKTFECLDQYIHKTFASSTCPQDIRMFGPTYTQDYCIVSLARFQSTSSLIRINYIMLQFWRQTVCR